MNKTAADYSFRYSGAMDNAMQSLPIGNGDIGANVWVDTAGKVHLLLSKSDAWSELYRLLKPAHVVLDIEPRPFADGADFELSIANGVLTIGRNGACLRIYMDAFAPCLRLSLRTESPVKARLALDNYRKTAFDPADDDSNYFMYGARYDIAESADQVLMTEAGGVAQIHRNEESCYEFALRHQDMAAYIGREADPLLGRTFGAGLYSPDMAADGEGLTAKEALTAMSASVFVETRFTGAAGEMSVSMDALHRTHGDFTEAGLERHIACWNEFWTRAYVYAQGDADAEQVTRAFLYQRYMTRCADRGSAPMKFNGSLFTADQMKGHPGNYDARNWGAPYWLQNTRIMYWYLLRAGDYDAMLPLFDMYLGMVPVATARSEICFGHTGMLIPETASSFGLYACSNYGLTDENGLRRRAIRRGEAASPYIRYHYNGMLELSWMMLKYMKASGDMSRRGRMLEFVEKTLLFFDRHFDKLDGKLVMYPVSSLETWQVCVNDAPDIAGLKAVCTELAGWEELPPSLQELLRELPAAVPDLPVEMKNGRRVLSPCEIRIDQKARNSENPELYAVFPYELYGLGKPELDMARLTYEQRSFRHDGGWSQDPVDAALLGLTEEAVKHMVRQSGMKDKRALFPAFWGPNFDETPDQDHGCMMQLCLINMLLQTDGDSYTAFPAWPKKWDVAFRLPVKKNVYVRGAQTEGVRSVVNEVSVGDRIRASDLSGGDVFPKTKHWVTERGYTVPSPEPKRPLLIKHGWEFPSVTFVAENIRTMEKRPVDGVVISMDDNLSEKVMRTVPVSYEQFAENLRPLANLNSPTLKHNFIIVFATPAGSIFDKGWDVVAQNFGNLAKAANEVGLEGIFFDIEEYFGDSLIYPTNCGEDKTVEEAQRKMRERGREIMDVMRAYWRDVRFLSTHGPYLSDSATFQFLTDHGMRMPAMPDTDVAWANLLGSSLLVGMMQSAYDTEAKFIDGGEFYEARTLEQFQTIKYWQKDGMKAYSVMIPDDFRPYWSDATSSSFGIYDQPLFNWDTKEIIADMDVVTWKSTIINALKTADDYVWLYSERYDWWRTENCRPETPLPKAWEDATREARQAVGNDSF